MPLVDCNFTLLPVHFAIDPAVDDTTTRSSYDRQMSLSEQVELVARYLDIQRVPVARNASSPDELLEPGEMRPRTGTWGGRDTDSSQTSKTDTQAAEADKKKLKSNFMHDKMTKRFGLLGRAVSKRLKPGGKSRELAPGELKVRRKASVGTATQSTRLTSLTDDMLMDHTQVNTLVSCSRLCLLFLLLAGFSLN